MASSKSANVRLGLQASPFLKGLKKIDSETVKVATHIEGVLSGALKSFDKTAQDSAKKIRRAYGRVKFGLDESALGTIKTVEDKAIASAKRIAKAYKSAGLSSSGGSSSESKKDKGAARLGMAKDMAMSGGAAAAMLGGGGLLLAREANKVRELSNRLSINSRGSGEAYMSPDKLAKQFFAVSQKVKGITGEQAAEAATAYVTDTGDLKTALGSIEDFATVASATGSNLTDVAKTAAAIAKQFNLTDPKDIRDVLASLTYQGKGGAFELADAASLFPRLAASGAGLGGLTGVEGVKTLGGLAQISRGNFGNAESSTTAVERLISNFTEKSDKLKAAGVNVYDQKTGQKRDLRTLILESIEKVGGNSQATKEKGLSDIFGDGFKSISGLSKTYNKVFAQTKGTDKEKASAARAAIDAEFAKAANAAGSFADVQQDSARAQEDATAKATAAFERLKMAASERLLPALLKLEPKIMSLMDMFTKAVEWAASNPAKAISAAIVAGIAKEAIGTAISGALTKAMSAAPLSFGAVAFAAAAVTMTVMSLNEDKAKGYDATVKDIDATEETLKKAEKMVKEKGTIDPATEQELRNAYVTAVDVDNSRRKLDQQGGPQAYKGITGGMKQAADIAAGYFTAEEFGAGAAATDRTQQVQQQMQVIKAILESTKKEPPKTPTPIIPTKMELAGTPKVIIANPDDIGSNKNAPGYAKGMF